MNTSYTGKEFKDDIDFAGVIYRQLANINRMTISMFGANAQLNNYMVTNLAAAINMLETNMYPLHTEEYRKKVAVIENNEWYNSPTPCIETVNARLQKLNQVMMLIYNSGLMKQAVSKDNDDDDFNDSDVERPNKA